MVYKIGTALGLGLAFALALGCSGTQAAGDLTKETVGTIIWGTPLADISAAVSEQLGLIGARIAATPDQIAVSPTTGDKVKLFLSDFVAGQDGAADQFSEKTSLYTDGSDTPTLLVYEARCARGAIYTFKATLQYLDYTNGGQGYRVSGRIAALKGSYSAADFDATWASASHPVRVSIGVELRVASGVLTGSYFIPAGGLDEYDATTLKPIVK